MDKKIYLGAAIVLIVILIGLGFLYKPAATTVATTVATTTAVTNLYNTTTTALPTNSVVNMTSQGCVASKYFTCNNTVYSKGNKTLSFTISENTGTSWSSFGVAFAPQGTTLSGGVPQGIAFYATNLTAGNNVGASLAAGAPLMVKLTGVSTGSRAVGTIWVCYTNSGILYAGNGCTTVGGVAAQYQVLGTINVTASS